MLPLFDSRTVVVSRGPSAASDRAFGSKSAMPASDSVVRKRRPVRDADHLGNDRSPLARCEKTSHCAA
jgi:hypothetical protein